jgi:hypothetical protein
MANLIEEAVWEAGIRQIETTDPVIGGPPNPATGAGLSNIQAYQLARRTAWLRAQFEALVSDFASLGIGDVGGLTDALALLAPKASPVFTGNPTAPTPAQFDADTSVATTEFVQRALGNLAGFTEINANVTLTAAQAGRYLQVNGARVVTLPPLSQLPEGATYHFRNDGTAPWTLIAQAGELIHGHQTQTNAVAMPSPISPFSVTKVAGAWHLRNALAHDGGFASSLSNPGWQRLPSGLIRNFGTVTLGAVGNVNTQSIGGTTFYTNYYNISFPLAFTTATYGGFVSHACPVFASQASMAGRAASFNLIGTGNSLTGFTLAYTTPLLGEIPTVHWEVIGR